MPVGRSCQTGHQPFKRLMGIPTEWKKQERSRQRSGECLNPTGRVIHRIHHFYAINLQSAEETHDEYISESAYPYIIARCLFC
jgi:hypothetical protein